MITNAPELTMAGKSLIIRGIGGERITFTRFAIGNGEVAGDTESLTALVNPILSFGISEAKVEVSGFVQLTGSFNSDDIVSDFRWTELGIYAKGEDDAEMLYAYAYDPENAAMLVSETDVYIEQNVSFVVAVGEAENVTALISPSALYASKPEFDQHLEEKNPHKITAAMINLGNVPNVGTDDQTPTYETPSGTAQALVSGERLGTAMGKIARAVLDLIGHLAHRNNPHGVTADQAGAAKKKHTHAAADINSGILSIERGGTGVGSVDALRTFMGSGIVAGVYFGDNTVKRHIDLGFRPAAVLISSGHGLDDASASDGVTGGLCVGEYGFRTRSSKDAAHETVWDDEHTAALISDNGFWVSYRGTEYPTQSIATNKSGETYRYVAWR